MSSLKMFVSMSLLWSDVLFWYKPELCLKRVLAFIKVKHRSEWGMKSCHLDAWLTWHGFWYSCIAVLKQNLLNLFLQYRCEWSGWQGEHLNKRWLILDIMRWTFKLTAPLPNSPFSHPPYHPAAWSPNSHHWPTPSSESLPDEYMRQWNQDKM